VQPTYIKGTVDVTSDRSFTISGYANTSKGKVTTKVAQTVDFYSYQYFDITASEYMQEITQGNTVASTTTVTQSGVPTAVTTQNYTFPLIVDITELVLSDGDINQTTTAKQTYQLTTNTTQSGVVTYSSTLDNDAQHVDTLEFDSSFNLLGNKGQSSSQQYNSFDSTGAAYDCAISAVANLLTAFSPGCAQ
jgi:hypothetical protein